MLNECRPWCNAPGLSSPQPADRKQSRERWSSSTCFCLFMAVFTMSIQCLELLPSRVSLKSSRTGLCLNLAVNAESKPLLFVYPSLSPPSISCSGSMSLRLDNRKKLNADDDCSLYWIMRGSKILTWHELLTCVPSSGFSCGFFVSVWRGREDG